MTDRVEVDVSGPSAGNRFVTSARHNTLHSRSGEYHTIAERNTYYKAMQWLLSHDPVLGASPASGIRFFGAAAEVTGYQGIGGLELPFAGVVAPPDVVHLAHLVNQRLHALNLGVLRRVAAARDLVDPQASLAAPRTALDFDLRMVETEQQEVERLVVAHPLSPYGRWVLNQAVNTSIPYAGTPPVYMVWARAAMGVPALDFTDQQHRMAIGRAMVFRAHGRGRADYLRFISSGATMYPSTPSRPGTAPPTTASSSGGSTPVPVTRLVDAAGGSATSTARPAPFGRPTVQRFEAWSHEDAAMRGLTGPGGLTPEVANVANFGNEIGIRASARVDRPAATPSNLGGHPGRPSVRRAGEVPLQRFEAAIHEAAERQGLTSTAEGRDAPGGLTNEEASAVYMGNWMRDMNQVFVPMVTNTLRIPPEGVFAMMSYLAANKFGLSMTPEQFGYSVPAEHMDSPAGLTTHDDLLSRQPRIPPGPGTRGPARPSPYVTPQEDVDLLPGSGGTGSPAAGPNLFAVDQTGTAAWIRRSNAHVERRLELAARRGRNPDGMMHFGAALHAVEDLFAHSNWVEIAVNLVLPREHDANVPRADAIVPEELAGQHAFTYSVTQTTGARDERGQEVVRPVLMTGSFTGSDTQVSLASELTGFLSRPLPPPTNPAELEAKRQFVSSLIGTYDAQIRADPTFQQEMRRVLGQQMPGLAADALTSGSLQDIYNMRLPVPEAARRWMFDRTAGVRAAIDEAISTQVLQPAGRRLQSEALNASVSGTSLVTGLRQQERRRTQTVAQLDRAERERMAGLERLRGTSVAAQNAEAQAAAGRHADALQATPERIVAGPTHSQLSKDHPNSPFFGLAFRLAAEAVRRLRELMVAAWAEQSGGRTRPFRFDWEHYPHPPAPHDHDDEPRPPTPDEQEHALFHQTRPRRGQAARESRERGNRIVAEGGDRGNTASFQPYDIAAMRHDSAQQIRAAAAGLRAAAGSPAEAAAAMVRLSALLGQGEQIARLDRARLALEETAASTRRGGAQANQHLQPNALADQLDTHAGAVERALTQPTRERVNRELVRTRDAAIRALLAAPTARAALAASVIALLDKQIAETAPAYTAEHRVILESNPAGADQFAEHRGHRGPLPTTRIDMPDASRTIDPQWQGGVRGPALAALIQESRRLLNHPYEDAGDSSWWMPVVREYARRHTQQLRTDIEARNAGYAVLRRPGEVNRNPHGHTH